MENVEHRAAGSETRAERTWRLDRQHVFHSWSAQGPLNPMVIERTEGSRVWDGDGNEYLDFSSQLVNTNIGHQHPRVVAAIQEQAARICTIAPAHANEARSEAAALIAETAPEGMDSVFFTNGGADANEHAVRMARVFTGRQKVLTTYRSYHGGTALAVNLTGDTRRWASDTASAGVVHFWGPYLYRSPFNAQSEMEECERALAHLEQTIIFEGASTIAAILLESIPGTAGVMPPPAGYIAGVRALCDRFGIVMIIDEVMTGFARVGEWFGTDLSGVVPDLMTFAKGVNSGYVPLGGVIIGDEVRDYFSQRAYPGGLTYSGHPLAAASAVATIQTMRDEGTVNAARRLGEEILGPGLREIASRHASVGEVRGLGAMWVLELVRSRETREPLVAYAEQSRVLVEFSQELRSLGVLPMVNGNRLHVVPPCNVSDADAAEGLRAIDHALEICDGAADG